MGAAPAAPVLKNPANGSSHKTEPVNLEWNPVTPPAGVTLVSYEVQIATNATFTAGLQPTLPAPTSATPNYDASGLTSGVTYYWRVRARFGDASTPTFGAFSLVRNFKFDNVAPPAPNLTAPANKAILAAVRPTLTWAAVAGATSYLLDVDDDPENDGICDFTLASMIREDVVVTAPAVSYMIPVPGLAQGSYCWRVQSKDAAGNVGSESTSRSFSIFIGTAPANGVFAPAGKPAFTWAAAVSPTLGYDLEVATDTAFTTFASGYPKHFGPAVLTYTVPAAALPLPPGTYYWRVRKTNEPEVSIVYRTLFVGAAPAAPVLKNPANGSSHKTEPVNLEWNPVTPPAGVTLVNYEVQIATNATFTAGLQSTLPRQRLPPPTMMHPA